MSLLQEVRFLTEKFILLNKISEQKTFAIKELLFGFNKIYAIIKDPVSQGCMIEAIKMAIDETADNTNKHINEIDKVKQEFSE